MKKIYLPLICIMIALTFISNNYQTKIFFDRVEALSNDEDNWHPNYHKEDNLEYTVMVTKTIPVGPYNIPMSYEVPEKRYATCCMPSAAINWCNFSTDASECDLVSIYVRK